MEALQQLLQPQPQQHFHLEHFQLEHHVHLHMISLSLIVMIRLSMAQDRWANWLKKPKTVVSNPFMCASSAGWSSCRVSQRS